MNDKVFTSIVNDMARIRAIEDRIAANSGMTVSDVGKAIANYAIDHGMSAVSGNDGHGNRYVWRVVAGTDDHDEADGRAAIKKLESMGVTVPTHTVKGRSASLRKS